MTDRVNPKVFEQLRDALRAAPDDARLLHEYCHAGEEIFPDEIISTLQERLSKRDRYDAIRLNELALHAHFLEKNRRRLSGLPLRNTCDILDLDYRFARPELDYLIEEARGFLALYPSSVGAAILLTEALTSMGDAFGAEAILAQLRDAKVSHVAAVTSFDPAFHSALTQTDGKSFADFPQVSWKRHLPVAAPSAIYVSADHLYFEKFGWDFLESYAVQRAPAAVVLHIMDMTPTEEVELLSRIGTFNALQIGVSTEWTSLRSAEKSNAARGYYHSMRFVRFWQFLLEHPNTASWILDADTTFGQSSERLFSLLSEGDVALSLFPGRMEIRNKILAGYVGVSPSARGREFAHRLAGYIASFARKGLLPWGIDQVALYAVLTLMRHEGQLPSVAGLPHELCDGSSEPGRILWPNKNKR